jgi:SAM-dependent methyltransferase
MQSALKKTAPAYESKADVKLKNSTLACPHCYRPLLHEEPLRCAECRLSWRRVGGVPFFASSSYWGEIPEKEMIQTNELAQKAGWRKAISEKIKGPYPDLYDDMTDETRADFRFILPLQAQSKVLEVGAGFGTVSFGLQPHCGWVTAVESGADQAQFIEIRRAEEGLENMEVAIANALELPFAPETFDFIIVNGYLESIGLINPTVHPRLLQKRFLSQLHRLLKPGGAVYIGTKNRFGYYPFLGSKDHRGLKYTGNLMPRWISDLFRRYFSKQSYRIDRPQSDTYGKRGYRKLLSESGFSETEFFMPSPGYHKPVELVSLDHPYPFQFFINNAISPTSILGKIKKKVALWGASIGWTQFFSPHFSIIAWKEGRYD